MPNTRGHEHASLYASFRRRLLKPTSALSIPEATANPAAIMLATHVEQAGFFKRGQRITPDPIAKKIVNDIRRSLGQMVRAAPDHAAPGSRIARKVINDLSNGSIETLRDLDSAREKFAEAIAEYRRNAASSEPGNVSLGRGFYMRGVTEEDVRRVGNEMQNCLANKGFSDTYKNEIRQGEIALYVICNAKRKPVVLIAVDPEAYDLRNCKGRKNNRPGRYREIIIVALRKLKVSIGECPDALALGISDSELE